MDFNGLEKKSRLQSSVTCITKRNMVDNEIRKKKKKKKIKMAVRYNLAACNSVWYSYGYLR